MAPAALSNPYLVPATVRCAAPGCQHVKGAQNHWFTVKPGAGAVVLEVAKGVADVYGFSDLLPCCGEACLLRVISDLLKKEQDAHVDKATQEER